MESSKLGDFDEAAYETLFQQIVDGTVTIDDTSDRAAPDHSEGRC